MEAVPGGVRRTAVLKRFCSASPGLRHVAAVAELQGLNVVQMTKSLVGVPRFLRDLAAYCREARADDSFRPSLRELLPVMFEWGSQAGIAKGHYFHQDLWAARMIWHAMPRSHVDVGSRIDGFVAHLLVFTQVTVVDVRPVSSSVEGLTYVADDARYLASFPSGSVESLSSLHAVEHFGLGRYGDSIDPAAWRSALRAYERVLSPGGRLYLGVPVGRQRLLFNAHRVFRPQTILEELSALRLVSFAAVDDNGDLKLDASPRDYENADYACGLFEFAKV
jgi:SAM-dependent methyltransferase